MIGRLRGTLLSKNPPDLLIETQAGVAYEVTAPMNTFYQLPNLGDEVILHTHCIIREDAHTLFGFHTLMNRALFRALIKVNGVGPRLALAILSSIEPSVFADCLQYNDTAMLVKVPGVGKKTAERLIIEMRDKMQGWMDSTSQHSKITPKIPSETRNSVFDEAMSALIALGYRAADASRLLQKNYQDNVSCEELIRLALKEVTV